MGFCLEIHPSPLQLLISPLLILFPRMRPWKFTIVSVHENFGGIQTDVVKNQYKKIFPEFFPGIKISPIRMSMQEQEATSTGKRYGN